MDRSHHRIDAAFNGRKDVVRDGLVKLPSRHRLIDRLIEETGGSSGLQRLTLLRAPTGYGKTLTMTDWLGDGSDPEDHVRWIHGDPSDCQSMWPAIARALAPFTTSLSVAHGPADVIRQAEQLTENVTLIIDDYHHATSAENDMAIADLVSASSKLMVVVIGRRVTLLDGPLVSARIRVRLIGPADLALTPEETDELARALGVPPSENLSSAFEQTAGWPLAVRAALDLGSDSLYLGSNGTNGTHGTNNREGVAAAEGFDPIENLRAFAIATLELLSEDARRVILAAAMLDALRLTQVQQILGCDQQHALRVVQQLLELGLLTEASTEHPVEYRCHSAVKEPLQSHASQYLPVAEVRELYRVRGDDVLQRAPFTAFKLYCAAEQFEQAEIVLARNFTLITNEAEECTKVLRWVPEHVLVAHPTFAAGLLMLELPRPSVAPSSLGYVSSLWQQGLKARLPEGATASTDPIYLPLICQAMVAARLNGDMRASHSLLLHLESRLTSTYERDHSADPLGGSLSSTVAALTASFPTYFREAAATALMVGDYDRARRNLERLKRHCEQLIARPWRGFSTVSTRTVSDPVAGQRWLLTALGELAYTEMLDGDLHRSRELLELRDAHAAQSGERAPGISWFGAEITRAHLAYELQDQGLLQTAAERLLPLSDRLEHWPLLMTAEANMIRTLRGNEWALTQLQARLSEVNASLRAPSSWTESLSAYQSMLCALIGDLSQATAILGGFTEHTTAYRIEHARLSLYAGDDVAALIAVQRIGDAVATKRQLLDRSIIGAVAAWGCGRADEAVSALQRAAELIENHGGVSRLWNVPFDMLREVAVAARERGACDLVATVDGIPEPLRSRRYEHLTEMELQSLIAIAEYRNTGQAAASLYVTPATVKKHLASVYRKLRAKNRDEAILFATRMGLLRPSE